MGFCFKQDILKQATEDRLTSAKELPYFEGDFWPNVLEESIKELEQEEEERKREENTSNESTDVRVFSLCSVYLDNLIIQKGVYTVFVCVQDPVSKYPWLSFVDLATQETSLPPECCDERHVLLLPV